MEDIRQLRERLAHFSRGRLHPANPPTLYHANTKLPGQGYSGRSGIYEMVAIDEEMRRMIHDGAGEHEMEAYARTQTPGIRQVGLDKVRKGITTLEEVLRVTQAD